MWLTPRAANRAEPAKVIGPKTAPMPPVPRFLHDEQADKNRDRDRHDEGFQPRGGNLEAFHGGQYGMAGVIIPSRRAARSRTRPRRSAANNWRDLRRFELVRAISARMPPSPLLSARSTYATYLNET